MNTVKEFIDFIFSGTTECFINNGEHRISYSKNEYDKERKELVKTENNQHIYEIKKYTYIDYRNSSHKLIESYFDTNLFHYISDFNYDKVTENVLQRPYKVSNANMIAKYNKYVDLRCYRVTETDLEKLTHFVAGIGNIRKKEMKVQSKQVRIRELNSVSYYPVISIITNNDNDYLDTLTSNFFHPTFKITTTTNTYYIWKLEAPIYVEYNNISDVNVTLDTIYTHLYSIIPDISTNQFELNFWLQVPYTVDYSLTNNNNTFELCESNINTVFT